MLKCRYQVSQYYIYIRNWDIYICPYSRLRKALGFKMHFAGIGLLHPLQPVFRVLDGPDPHVAVGLKEQEAVRFRWGPAGQLGLSCPKQQTMLDDLTLNGKSAY